MIVYNVLKLILQYRKLYILYNNILKIDFFFFYYTYFIYY